MSAASASTAIGTIATASTDPAPYRGRFAPSPTGELHLGSLLAAMASYLEARRHGGHWLLRIEDLDTPRLQPGAAGRILAVLEGLGFEWDETPAYQSQRLPLYAAALRDLQQAGLLYRCRCSRRERGAEAACVADCCERALPPHLPAAWRLRLTLQSALGFVDDFQGACPVGPLRRVDPILQRRDGLFAYALAVVVDDAAQRISAVVRGADLLEQTHEQIGLQHCLSLPTPRYAHAPLLTETGGAKLSKSRHAVAIGGAAPAVVLTHTLALLAQRPPPELARASVAQVWDWARQYWNPQAFRGIRSLSVAAGAQVRL
ncbi:MAG: tRNA glutamyl-Q(34) synthetase GluQRS [Steroidobacteraceae bacterium]